MIYYNFLWELVLKFVECFGFRMVWFEQNWLSMVDIYNLFYLSDFEVVCFGMEILVLVNVLFVVDFVNWVGVKLLGLRYGPVP